MPQSRLYHTAKAIYNYGSNTASTWLNQGFSTWLKQGRTLTIKVSTWLNQGLSTRLKQGIIMAQTR